MNVLNIAIAFTASVISAASDLTYKEKLLPPLASKAPGILKTYDPQSGRFGTGIWVCGDQNDMFPLAVLYSQKADGNPYYKDKTLLETIMKAGDALIADADDQGRWEFRKKDGSTWGPRRMPWTYSRWIRAFDLIRDDMPPERRAAWEKALVLGFTGIAKSELGRVHNIPTHQAMGLYVAGRALKKPEWCETAAAFMHRVVSEQRECGYWSEGAGPVVHYNFVYIDAIGTYFALSKDGRVLPALEKAAAFHRAFTYPDGNVVETIDERNPFREGVTPGNVGFTTTPVGRAYLAQQWEALGGVQKLGADLLASLVLYGEEGAIAEVSAKENLFVLNENGTPSAATLRNGPWFICVSAYHNPIQKNRWLQDRQNFVSIYHDRAGLILGGGNTKLQPAWSTFTVGDTSLLKHTPGDEDPDFLPKGELFHVPSKATLITSPELGLDFEYGSEQCKVRIETIDDTKIEYQFESTQKSTLPLEAHITLLPHLDQTIETSTGEKVDLKRDTFDLDPAKSGGSFTYAGCRFTVPSNASLHWPAKAHNPYKKAGESTPEEARLEIRIPLTAKSPAQTVQIEILSKRP